MSQLFSFQGKVWSGERLPMAASVARSGPATYRRAV